MKVKGDIPTDNRSHTFCPDCWAETIQPYDREGKEFYRCDSCGYDDSRAIIIYPQMRYEIKDDQELLHYSAGAIIEWKGRFLLFRRRLFPFQYTVIAGHWDLDDPTPADAIVREVKEESGLEVSPTDPPIVEMLQEPCRRGADFHEWHLFQMAVDTNLVTMSDEADIIGWYLPEEIRELEMTIPTEYFLKKLKII